MLKCSRDHHARSLSTRPADLPEYAEARRQEKELLTQWLSEAQSAAVQAGQAG